MNYNTWNNSLENFFNTEISVLVSDLKVINTDSNPSEIKSWEKSLGHLQNLLKHSNIPKNINIVLECFVPNAHNKIDVVLIGRDLNNNPKIILLELKQWSDENVEFFNGKKLTSLKVKFEKFEVMRHPAIQVFSYKKQLEMYNESLKDITILPIVYLHNYKSNNIKDKNLFEYQEDVKIFCKDDNLENFLLSEFNSGDHLNIILDKLLNGNIKPNKKLADVLTNILNGQEEYILDEYQDSIFQKAIRYYNIASRKNKGILIEGAPGTGKSVVAINLLSHFLSENKNAVYITKNAAPRIVFSSLLDGDFKYNANQIFVNPSSKKFDIAIVDEAHRLTTNQLISILNNCYFVICFIDGKQMVHCDDIGSKENIYSLQDNEGNSPFNKNHEITLQNQYRCSSLTEYTSWLDSILYNQTLTKKLNFQDLGYDFQIFENIDSFYNEIKQKYQEFNSTRIVAGYCWEWKSKNNTNLFDIEIENFKCQWNLNSYESGQGSASWIIQNSFEQIGCIHTCQGLEVDYMGVIIGDDLFYDDNTVYSNLKKRAKDDFSIRNCSNNKNKIDEIIRNTYRVLLTRGMKGCYVYCTNKKLYEYIKSTLIGLNR